VSGAGGTFVTKEDAAPIIGYEENQKALSDIDNQISNNQQQGRFIDPTRQKRLKELQAERDILKKRSDQLISETNKDVSGIISKGIGDDWEDFTNELGDIDVSKIGDFARQEALNYGLPEDGYFFERVKNAAKSKVEMEKISPTTESFFLGEGDRKGTYEEMYGVKPGDDAENMLSREDTRKALGLSKLDAEFSSQMAQLNSDISRSSTEDIERISEERYGQPIEDYVSQLGQGYESESKAIESRYSSLIQDGNFVGSQDQYDSYQKELQSVREVYEGQVNDVVSQNMRDVAAVNNKANRRFNRQRDEILQAYKTEYTDKAKGINPILQERYQKAYNKALDKAMEVENVKKESRAMIRGKLTTGSFTGGLLASGLAAGASGQMSSILRSMGMKEGAEFFEQAAVNFDIGDTEIKGWKDILDPIKLVKSTSFTIGGMAPMLVASAGVGAVTGGVGGGAMLQTLAAGGAGWGVETISITQDAYDQKFKETGSVAKAEEAANKSFNGQVMLMPMYALEMVPFFGDVAGKLAKIGMNNAPARFIAGGVMETVSELGQEYPQQLFEQAIADDKELSAAFDYASVEGFESTVLNVAPTTFLLGGGGAATQKGETSKEDMAKALAMKVNIGELTETAMEQKMLSMTVNAGEKFSKAFVATQLMEGNITEEQAERATSAIESSVSTIEKGKEYNLDNKNNYILATLDLKLKAAKAKAESESDPMMKGIAESKVKKIEKQAQQLMETGNVDVALVTYPDGSFDILTHDEARLAMSKDEFMESFSSGDLKVEAMGESQAKLMSELQEKAKAMEPEAAPVEEKPTPRVFETPTDEKYAVVNEGKGEGDRVLTRQEYDEYVAPAQERQVAVNKGDKIQFSSDGQVFDGVVTRQTEDGVYIESDVSGEETLIPTNKVIATADMGIVAGDSVFIETEGGPVLGKVKSITDTEIEIDNPDVPGQTMTVDRNKARKIKEGSEVQYNVEGELETFKVKRIDGDQVVVENPDAPGSEISLSAEEVILKDPFKRTKDDTQTTEQEGVGTEEQVGEEGAGQVQETEVSQEEGAADPVLQEEEEVESTTEKELDAIDKELSDQGVVEGALTGRSRKRKVVKAVRNGIKAISKALPNVTIKLYETQAEFEEATGKKGNGYYNFKEKSININLDTANARTVAHEIFHAFLFNKISTNEEAASISAKLFLELNKVEGDNAKLVKELSDFASMYEEEGIGVMTEEMLAEYLGKVAENYDSLSAKGKRAVREFVNNMLELIGKANPETKGFLPSRVSGNEVVDMLLGIGERVAAGEVIEAEQVEGLFTPEISVEVSESSEMTGREQLNPKEVKSKNVKGKKVGKGLSVRQVKGQKVKEGIDNISVKKAREANPKLYIKNANILKDYDIVKGVNKFRDIQNLKQADEVYDIFVNEAAENLIYLHDKFNQDLLDYATLWYDGANQIAQELASEFNISLEQAAGIIAGQSPQKDWYQNVRLAEMVLEQFKSNPVFTQEALDFQKEINERGYKDKSGDKLRKARERGDKLIAALESFVGQNLNDIPDAFKPYVVRTTQEISGSKDYDVISPDGRKVGLAKKNDGSNAKVAWGAYNEIGKAVSIYLNGSQKNISDQLGVYHKIRNFFNNISDPMSEDNDVTMDTHAVAAALLKPLSGKSKQVGQNFGAKTSNSGPLGLKGVYYAFADAYVKAAKEKGILPREMQSITWEAARGLFTDSYKANKANVKEVNDIFKDYTNGKITKDEAREKVLEAAGGVNDPTWSGPILSELGKDSKKKADTGRLPGDERGGKRSEAKPRDRGRDTGDVSGVTGRDQKTKVKTPTAKKPGVSPTQPFAGREQKTAAEVYSKIGMNEDQVGKWKENNRKNFKMPHPKEAIDAVKKYAEGKISLKKYNEVIKKVMPIVPYDSVPIPASLKDIALSLRSNKLKSGIIGLNASIKEGEMVSSRLDIPAYMDFGIYVDTIHGPKGKGVLGYGQSVALKNVTFGSSAIKALKVALGEQSKSPFAVMEGAYKNESTESAVKRAEEALKSDEWVQVGFNPYRHAYFYDKANSNPVVSAKEVIQVGPLVMAKGVVYGKPLESTDKKTGEIVRFQKDESDLLAPNGEPSNLTPQQYETVRTPAFKKWFGDWENDPKNASKVVDKNGEPLVVYHGSVSKNLEVFNKGEKKNYNTVGDPDGFYFTNNRNIAYNYTQEMREDITDRTPRKKGKVYSTFLNIRNPLDVTDAIAKNDSKRRDRRKPYQKFKLEEYAKFDAETNDGYINEYSESQNEYIATSSNQIKLADGSNKTFDPDSPIIRLQKDESNPLGNYEMQKNALKGKIKAIIDFKNKYGRYFNVQKEFNDQRHMDNYISLMERKGNKEIGVERVAEVPDVSPTQPFAGREQKNAPLFSGKNRKIVDLANKYIAKKGLAAPQDTEIRRLNTEYSKAMADVYEAAKNTPLDKDVQRAYKALAKESKEQFEVLKKDGYVVELWDGANQPYENSTEMVEDLKDNKHLYVFSTEEGFGESGITPQEREENPMLADSGYKDANGKKLLMNDLFRFVHDTFGHGKLGNSFGPVGEENAWYVHSQMFSPDARRAMTSETRGQNSWVNFGPQLRDKDGSLPKKGDKNYVPMSQREFAPQKNFLFPEEYVFDRPNTQGRFEGREQKVKVDKSTIKKNVIAAVDFIKKAALKVEDGVTLNIDGTRYDGGGLVVPISSMNVEQGTLKPSSVADFVEMNKGKLSNDTFKLGLYKFPKESTVSIDLSVIVPNENRKLAISVGKKLNQESLFDLDSGENIKTGGTGQNTVELTDEQAAELATSLAENKEPEFLGRESKSKEKKRGFLGRNIEKLKFASNLSESVFEDPEAFYEPQVLAEIKENAKYMSDSELVEAMSLDGLNSIMNISGSTNTNMAVLAAAELINRKLAADQDVESVVLQLNKMGTAVGQLMRQFGELKKSTPAGYMLAVERLAEKNNIKLNDIDKKKISKLIQAKTDLINDLNEATEKRLDPNLSLDEQKKLDKEIKKISNELYKVDSELNRFVQTKIPLKLTDTLIQIMQGNLLTLGSLVVNIVGNITQLGLSLPIKLTASSFDFLRKFIIGGERTTSFSIPAYWYGAKSFAKALPDAARILFWKGPRGDYNEMLKGEINNGLLGIRAWMALMSKGGMPEVANMSKFDKLLSKISKDLGEKKFFAKADVFLSILSQGTFGIPADIMFRALQAGDVIFKRPYRDMSLYEIGKRKGLSGERLESVLKYPSKKELDMAEEIAKEGTFQEDSTLSSLSKEGVDFLSKWASKAPYVGNVLKLLVRSKFPYVKTPANIASFTFKMCVPEVAFAASAVYLSKGDNRKAALNFGIGVTGAMTSTVAAGLVANGLAQSMGDDDEPEVRGMKFAEFPPGTMNRSALNRVLDYIKEGYGKGGASEMGDRFNQFLTGDIPKSVTDVRPGEDEFVSYLKLGMPGFVLGVYSMEERDTVKDRAINAKKDDITKMLFTEAIRLPQSIRFVTQQSFLQGTADLMKTMTFKEGAIRDWSVNTVRTVSSIALPNQLASFARTQRDYLPDYRSDDAWTQIKNVLDDKIFFLRKETPMNQIRVDIWGRSIDQTPEGANRYMYHLGLDPLRKTKPSEDLVNSEILNLAVKTKSSKAYPKFINDVVKSYYKPTGKSEDFILNKDQVNKLQRIYGQRNYEKVRRLILDGNDNVKLEWEFMDDETKLNKLSKIYSETKKDKEFEDEKKRILTDIVVGLGR